MNSLDVFRFDDVLHCVADGILRRTLLLLLSACLVTDGVVISPDVVVACSCVYRLVSVIVPKVVSLVKDGAVR